MQIVEVYERMPPGYRGEINDSLELELEQRVKGRFKAASSGGREVRVFLERGTPLAIDSVLRSTCGLAITVRGVDEEVALARCADWPTFSKACYHLGNRHVALQVGERWLCFKPDHVLEDMLRQLGLTVIHEQRLFDPEPGAYAHASHGH